MSSSTTVPNTPTFNPDNVPLPSCVNGLPSNYQTIESLENIPPKDNFGLSLTIWVLGIFVAMVSPTAVPFSRMNFPSAETNWFFDIFNNRAVLMVAISLATGAILDSATRWRYQNRKTLETVLVLVLAALALLCAFIYGNIAAASERQLYDMNRYIEQLGISPGGFELFEYAFINLIMFVGMFVLGLIVFILGKRKSEKG